MLISPLHDGVISRLPEDVLDEPFAAVIDSSGRHHRAHDGKRCTWAKSRGNQKTITIRELLAAGNWCSCVDDLIETRDDKLSSLIEDLDWAICRIETKHGDALERVLVLEELLGADVLDAYSSCPTYIIESITGMLNEVREAVLEARDSLNDSLDRWAYVAHVAERAVSDGLLANDIGDAFPSVSDEQRVACVARARVFNAWAKATANGGDTATVKAAMLDAYMDVVRGATLVYQLGERPYRGQRGDESIQDWVEDVWAHHRDETLAGMLVAWDAAYATVAQDWGYPTQDVIMLVGPDERHYNMLGDMLANNSVGRVTASEGGPCDAADYDVAIVSRVMYEAWARPTPAKVHVCEIRPEWNSETLMLGAIMFAREDFATITSFEEALELAYAVRREGVHV